MWQSIIIIKKKVRATKYVSYHLTFLQSKRLHSIIITLKKKKGGATNSGNSDKNKTNTEHDNRNGFFFSFYLMRLPSITIIIFAR